MEAETTVTYDFGRWSAWRVWAPQNNTYGTARHCCASSIRRVRQREFRAFSIHDNSWSMASLKGAPGWALG